MMFSAGNLATLYGRAATNVITYGPRHDHGINFVTGDECCERRFG